MDIFIYFYNRLPVALDEMEDRIEGDLDGIGEVSGSGVGDRGSNIDVRLSDLFTVDGAIEKIRLTLAKMGVKDGFKIVVGGRTFGPGCWPDSGVGGRE